MSEAEPAPRDVAVLPKAHLHLHFTGSMRHSTLLELAARDGIALPDQLVEDWPPKLSAADEKGWFRFQRLYDVARRLAHGVEDQVGELRDPPELRGVAAGVDLDLQPAATVTLVVLGRLQDQPAYVARRPQH